VSKENERMTARAAKLTSGPALLGALRIRDGQCHRIDYEEETRASSLSYFQRSLQRRLQTDTGLSLGVVFVYDWGGVQRDEDYSNGIDDLLRRANTKPKVPVASVGGPDKGFLLVGLTWRICLRDNEDVLDSLYGKETNQLDASFAKLLNEYRVTYPALLEAFHVFSALHTASLKLTRQELIDEIQNYLTEQEGKSFGAVENRLWTKMLNEFLESHGLRITCLRKDCMKPSLLRYRKGGTGSEGHKFSSEHMEKGARQQHHGGKVTIPHLTVVQSSFDLFHLVSTVPEKDFEKSSSQPHSRPPQP
jgi:hypothetical protein